MLYEEPGQLLSRAGQLLASGNVDEQVLTQLRSIGVQLKRLGAMWPDLFITLAQENAILLKARADVAAHMRGHDIGLPHLGGPDPEDPINLYRHLLKQLNDALPLLHQHRHDASAAALTSLRQAIREAGRVQAQMVDKAWLV